MRCQLHDPRPSVLLRAWDADPEVGAGQVVVAGFTTGGSPGVGPISLELSPAAEPSWTHVISALHPGLELSGVAVLEQVHGAEVVVVDRPRGPWSPVAAADGAITARVGVVLAVRTADCVPVLLAAPGVVGVAHAGWRGTAAGVVGATVDAMTRAGGCGPRRVRAAIGPHISGTVYEVGEEVVEALRAAGLAEADFLRPGPRRAHVDLGAAVEAQLRAAGVVDLGRSSLCTVGDPRFHSYRRDGARAGRQAGLIARIG